MKKFYHLAISAIVSVSLTGCFFGGGGTEEPTYKVTDLQALWQENGTEHFVRFTDERADEYPYYFGREWNEDEDVREEDLYVYIKGVNDQDSLIHGNGWFQYKLERKGDLEEIHFMENGGAEIPKEYIVSVLTDEKLEYYEKDRPSSKFSFTKMAQSK